MNPNSLANLRPSRKGMTNNPGGKPVAARNKLSAYFLNKLLKDFEEHGEQAISETREKDPGAYLRVIASIVPKEMILSDGDTAVERILDTLGDKELAAFTEGLRLLAAAASGGETPTKDTTGKQPSGVH